MDCCSKAETNAQQIQTNCGKASDGLFEIVTRESVSSSSKGKLLINHYFFLNNKIIK